MKAFWFLVMLFVASGVAHSSEVKTQAELIELVMTHGDVVRCSGSLSVKSNGIEPSLRMELNSNVNEILEAIKKSGFVVREVEFQTQLGKMKVHEIDLETKTRIVISGDEKISVLSVHVR